MTKLLNKQMNLKVFYALCFILFGLWTVFITLMPYDSDLPFLIASGREIIANGLPSSNVWVIDDIPMLLQQWLFDILIAWFANFGWVGMWLFMLAQIVIVTALIHHLLKLRGVSTKLELILLVLTFLFNGYMYRLRPQTITLICLFIELIGFEHYRKSGKWAWLSLFPISVILEMNLHMSMWTIHFALLLAYIVPAFYYREINYDGIMTKKSCIPVIIFTLLSAGALFLNPYGVDGMMFVINSVTSGMGDIVTIAEHQPVSFLSMSSFIIVACLAAGIILIWKDRANSVTINFVLGFGLLAAWAAHNTMFLSISLVYLFIDCYKALCEMLAHKNIKVNWKKDIVVGLIPFFSILFIVLGSMTTSVAYQFSQWDFDYIIAKNGSLESVYYISEYLDKNADKDAHIFGGYIPANYLEYAGYTNVYIDARPESYTPKLTGIDKNILKEYSMYGSYGSDITGVETVDRTDVLNWLESYDFEYIIMEASSSTYLHGFADGSGLYEKVDYMQGITPISDDFVPNVFLYRRK